MDGAIERFKKVIELNKNDHTAHQFLSRCYFRQGKILEALIEIDNAIKLDPKNADYFKLKGEFFKRKAE